MLLTVVVIWAVVIPVAILAISGLAANLRDARVSRDADRSVPEPHPVVSPAGGMPACAVSAGLPRRTVTRRVCPALSRGARRRPASA